MSPNTKPKKSNISSRKLMNSMVNIPSTNPDPYYRYKMPALEIRINPARVRTNNPRNEPIEIPASTQIQNLSAVARALNRPIEYLSRYFELELELRGVMDDRWRWFKLCDAELSEKELVMVLDKFIRRFVLCYVCQNPETALTIYQSYITKECGACGQSTRVDRFSKLTRCRFLKDGASSGGTVMTGAMGFKNGVRLATAAEMVDDDVEQEEDENDDGQDWSIDTSAEAAAQRRLQELALITRVEKIMNAVLGDKAKDPYKVFEEFVITPRSSTTGPDDDLPDKDEVLGKYYTLDLEKEGAIFILERLKRRQEDHDEPQIESQVVETEEQEKKTPRRDDYGEMIQVLKDSLEREVVVKATLEESSSGSSSSEDEDEESEDEDEDEENLDDDRVSDKR
ncbi:hypothetical protein BGX31_009875 [Mortierella sp. GBA43]|nr:hypothetical protein BGX31_009875 [Mortierella sp. GBA43]